MTDIVEKALAMHKAGGNAEMTWTVSFVNGDKLNGMIRAYGESRYALMNSFGPVYFSGDKVTYLHLSN